MKVSARQWLWLAAACAYSLGAAATTPFTWPADLMTALPIVAMAVMVVVRWPLRTPPRHSVAGHPYVPYLALFVLFTGWELFNYLVHGSRSDHPTFSSMADAVNRFYALKALMFLAWLSFGWLIVSLGLGSETTGDLR